VGCDHFGLTTSGPVIPLPGCVEAGGSLAGNDISNSLASCRSCSAFGFGSCFLGTLVCLLGIASSWRFPRNRAAAHWFRRASFAQGEKRQVFSALVYPHDTTLSKGRVVRETTPGPSPFPLPRRMKRACANCHNGYAKFILTRIHAAELMGDPEYLGGYRDIKLTS
jgi:hypothetical protein